MSDRAALVLRASTLNDFQVADLLETLEALRQWQIIACQLAQSGDFDGLADHLMLPSPDVKLGDRVNLEESGKFYKIEAIGKDGELVLDNKLTINVKQVFSVEPSDG